MAGPADGAASHKGDIQIFCASCDRARKMGPKIIKKPSHFLAGSIPHAPSVARENTTPLAPLRQAPPEAAHRRS